jgi:hypothetical protein
MWELAFTVYTFPLSPSYGVTADGDVYRLETMKKLKPAIRNNSGYLAVSLWEDGKGKSWFVHQIVAVTFRGPRPSPKHHACHDDGNKTHNHKDNVMWKTKIENEHDKIRHGRSNRGDRNGMSKVAKARRNELSL